MFAPLRPWQPTRACSLEVLRSRHRRPRSQRDRGDPEGWCLSCLELHPVVLAPHRPTQKHFRETRWPGCRCFFVVAPTHLPPSSHEGQNPRPGVKVRRPAGGRRPAGNGRPHRDEEVLCHLRADSGHGLGGVGGWPKDLEVLTGAEREHLGISGEQGRIPPTIPNQPRITQGL